MTRLGFPFILWPENEKSRGSDHRVPLCSLVKRTCRHLLCTRPLASIYTLVTDRKIKIISQVFHNGFQLANLDGYSIRPRPLLNNFHLFFPNAMNMFAMHNLVPLTFIFKGQKKHLLNSYLLWDSEWIKSSDIGSAREPRYSQCKSYNYTSRHMSFMQPHVNVDATSMTLPRRHVPAGDLTLVMVLWFSYLNDKWLPTVIFNVTNVSRKPFVRERNNSAVAFRLHLQNKHEFVQVASRENLSLKMCKKPWLWSANASTQSG